MRRNFNREMLGKRKNFDDGFDYNHGRHKFSKSHPASINRCVRRDKKKARRIIDRVYKDLMEVE